jgi:hypothetical protein
VISKIARVGSAIAVTFTMGMIASLPLARANAPAGRYTVANGTVTDTKTTLVWQQSVSATTLYNWTDAKSYCAGLGATLGGSGWRLPTVRELLTIVDRSQATGPVIDQTAFPSTPAVAVWTATVWQSTGAWIVMFDTGRATTTGTYPNQNVVRCVR